MTSCAVSLPWTAWYALCCSGTMTVTSYITELAVVTKILRHIGLPSEPPELSPARGPALPLRNAARASYLS